MNRSHKVHKETNHVNKGSFDRLIGLGEFSTTFQQSVCYFQSRLAFRLKISYICTLFPKVCGFSTIELKSSAYTA
jgi:hypothetical protein